MPNLRNRPALYAAALLSVMLAGCAVPEKPEGVDTEGLTRIGDKLRANGDDAAAANFYERAIEHNPQDMAAYKDLAEIFEAHGDYANAAATLKRATTIKSDDAGMLRSYGRVLVEAGQPAEARAQYEHALRLDPSDIKAVNGLGISEDLMGNHALAQKTYERALDIKRDDPATLGNLGHSYVLAGEPERAVSLLEPHLHDPGVTPVLRQNLAEAYGMAGMDADAERVAEMDLSQAEVDQNMAYWRAHRKGAAYHEASVTPKAEKPKPASSPAPVSAVATAATVPETSVQQAPDIRLPPEAPPEAPPPEAAKAKAPDSGSVDSVAYFYADLGKFPTGGMADAHVAQVKAVFESDLQGLTVDNTPEVTTPGGTPQFVVRVTGFNRMAKVKNFCSKLRKKGIACTAHGG